MRFPICRNCLMRPTSLWTLTSRLAADRLNGLPLAKLHQEAFDAHFIGIDSDYRIHVSDRLFEIHDGPFLELGLEGIAETLIDRPRRLEDRPDRDRLAIRFEQFRRAA